MIELKCNMRNTAMQELKDVFDTDPPTVIAIKYDSVVTILTNNDQGYVWEKIADKITDAYCSCYSVFFFSNYGEYVAWMNKQV